MPSQKVLGKTPLRVLLSLRYLHPVGKANLLTDSWPLEVNSMQLALKLAARKALIIRSSA
ncbi:hypothetical protein F9Y84_19970 [Pseudoalteromonas peptidolytica]|nr:hypothetical protein [Pseudoalteromonas peptidolytica]